MAGAPAILKRFHEIYPATGNPHVWRAPGRVNLIGEHTDYNQGLVLPMAIGLECLAAAAPSNDGCLHVFSEQLGISAQWPVDEIANAKPREDWTDRFVGIAWELARRGRPIQAMDILISSNVPIGGGLSSSAALGVSLALAMGAPPESVAEIAQAAEVNFVGVPCGIMDQFVSAHGQDGAAILLDCRSLEWRAVKLPDGLSILASNSMVKHELGSSAYRTRVEECAAAARVLNVASLRDAKLDQLDRLDGVLLRRARHVINENTRVEAFATAAALGDLEGMGRLATESHRSLRDDYEVSCAELDFLVDTALAVPGVLGSRMTGGGFGGSTITLVRAECIENLSAALIGAYREGYHLTPDVHLCRPSAGASQIF